MPEAWIRREAVANHRAWLAARSLAMGGGPERLAGLATTVVPGGEACLPFPSLPPDRPSEALDAWLATVRGRGAVSASAWARSQEGQPGLGPRLVARGFEIGWQAHWMGIATDDLDGAPSVSGVRIAEEEDGTEVEGLPYRSAAEARTTRRLVECASRTTRRWVARADGRVVGHVVAHRRPDRPSAVGVYDMGVVPDWRRRGVARALLATLLREQRRAGAAFAVLNSAASSFYARIGFRDGGRGRTWWCHAPVFERGLPEPWEVLRGEAIGLGRVDLLEALHRDGRLPADPDMALPGGTGPVDLAVHCRQVAVVDWLEAHGATVTATHAWAIGGPARMSDLLRSRPDRLDRREGPFGATPLHRAVEEDDLPRVRRLLASGADTGVRDARFGATALGWARHLGRETIAAELVAAGAPA